MPFNAGPSSTSQYNWSLPQGTGGVSGTARPRPRGGGFQEAGPSAYTPFLNMGSVQNGRPTPNPNPYSMPSWFMGMTNPQNWGRTSGAGAGPINTGPSQMPSPMMSNPYMQRGGFTGATMPTPQYMDPNSANIPNVIEGSMNNAGGATSPTTSGIRNSYLGSGAALSNRPFRNKLFY